MTSALFHAAMADPVVTSESITIQGKGAGSTRTLTLKDGWVAQITADAAVTVKAVASDGTSSILVSFPAATPPPPSYAGSSLPIAKGGAYTLVVDTTGTWQISIVETGFDKNLAIGASPAPPPSTTPGTTPPITPATASSNTPPSGGLLSNFLPVGHYMAHNPAKDSAKLEDTDTFKIVGQLRVIWHTKAGIKISLVGSDGIKVVLVEDTSKAPADPSADISSEKELQPNPGWIVGSVTRPAIGTYHLTVEGTDDWMVSVLQQGTPDGTSIASRGASFPSSGASTSAAAAAAPTVKLTDEQARAVVLIKGDNGEGTGFLVKTNDGPAVVTNIHVISNNPNLKITTNTGAVVTVLSKKGASDRDLALLAIKDEGYSYLQFSTDISKDVSVGDEVITPGNSQGGEVMLNTDGKILGVGPDRLEFSNPIFHGNSGGPVFHPKSGKVVGIVTYGQKVHNSDDLDKASFANRNSAISGDMRYFGMRLDTVTSWITIDQRRFDIEGLFLDQFHEQSRRLDAYLNHTKEDSSAAYHTYSGDEKIMKADSVYDNRADGADAGQRLEAARGWLSDLQTISNTDFEQIKVKENFYGFDQARASEEMDYRKAILDELDKIGSNVDRISNGPRTNYQRSDGN